VSKISHKTVKEIALSDAEVAFIYDSMEPQKELLIKLAKLRKQSGYTQFDIAKKLSTSKSSISRLESGGGREQHSPSINTVKAYARAIGCEFSMMVFVPKEKSSDDTHR
jgi:transcriptional regulator with XRE-family HTH domain